MSGEHQKSKVDEITSATSGQRQAEDVTISAESHRLNRVNHKRSSVSSRLLELYLWSFVSLAPVIKPTISYYYDYENRRALLPEYLTSFFYTSLILVFPIVFKLTFGVLPLEALRQKFSSSQQNAGGHIGKLTPQKSPELVERVAAVETPKNVKDEHVEEFDPRKLLSAFTRKSEELCERVYTRAGVYLIVGVFISVGGLAFFYIRSLSLPSGSDLLDRVLTLLPAFGVLFFIEFVALFFLRQYRSAMDDFRYYDAIRRHREENLVLLAMFSENKSIVSTVDVIRSMRFYSGDQKISKDETTEILEARRMQRDEMVIFEKMLDTIGAIREKSQEKK